MSPISLPLSLKTGVESGVEGVEEGVEAGVVAGALPEVLPLEVHDGLFLNVIYCEHSQAAFTEGGQLLLLLGRLLLSHL